MNEALGWIGQFFETIALFVPRRVIIRATEGAIKWKYGKNVIKLGPGIHWYWPIVTDFEKIAVARQTLNLPTQTLFTSDQQQVVVSAVITYRINDIILAIGEKNWDLDETLKDTSQAAVVEVITKMTQKNYKRVLIIQLLSN